jgi:hypothetical protein
MSSWRASFHSPPLLLVRRARATRLVRAPLLRRAPSALGGHFGDRGYFVHRLVAMVPIDSLLWRSLRDLLRLVGQEARLPAARGFLPTVTHQGFRPCLLGGTPTATAPPPPPPPPSQQHPPLNPLLWRSSLDLNPKKCLDVDLTSTVRSDGRGRPTWPTTQHNATKPNKERRGVLGPTPTCHASYKFVR